MAKIYNGIDLSSYQSSVDWKKAAKELDFVILRSGFGNSVSQKDKMFDSHTKGAIAAGIPYIGVYHFSYARSAAEAEKEAAVCLSVIEPYRKYINLPVAFDWEYDSHDYCIRNGITPTKSLCNRMAKAFCAAIEAAGYTAMLYTNPDYGSRFFELNDFKHLWIAQYADKCSITTADIWQYTSSGKVSGIMGAVDRNVSQNERLFLKTTASNAPECVLQADANLRADAHLKAAVLQTLKKGTAVKWLWDDEWGWSKISAGNRIGFVENNRLQTAKKLSKWRKATCKVDGLNVRLSPKIAKGNVWRMINKGFVFDVICIIPGGWIMTKIDNKTCYISDNKSYVSIGGKIA